MDTTLFERIQLLPPAKQEQIEEYVELLLQKYHLSKEQSTEEIAEMRRRNMGRLKGQIWMADDFNETPEDFKDYI